MACYYPKFAFDLGLRSNGKHNIKFFGLNERYVDITDTNIYKNIIKLPCGKCLGCRLEYSRQWAIRCMLEAKKYEHNCFLTLTYDDDHLKVLPDGRNTLVPEHFTKFMKDLRRYFQYHFGVADIRFFGCGEYGKNTHRAHYHIILFNCSIPDLKLHSRTKAGSLIYESEILSNIWDKGFVSVGDVTWESCAYVARYCVKKIGDSSEYSCVDPDTGEIIKPIDSFVRMSRRPGIGRDYFEENMSDLYSNDELHIKRGDRTLTVKPPKYFDRLFSDIDIDRMNTVKESRREALSSQEILISELTDLSYFDRLGVDERLKISQIRSLRREIE